MATLDFVPQSNNSHRTATDQLVLRAVWGTPTVLTAAYVETTNDVNTGGWEYVHFAIKYTKGDETSLRIKPEVYDGTNWLPATFKATQATSYSQITLDLLECAASTTGVLPPISVLGFQKARISVIANGGTPTGTLAVTATASVTVKSR